METFFTILAIGEGFHRSSVDSPHKRPVMHSFDVSIVNNLLKIQSSGGGLKCHDVHVTSL